MGLRFLARGSDRSGRSGMVSAANEVEHFQEEEVLFAWRFAGGVEDGRPVAEGVERAFEADAGKRLVIS